MLKNAENDEKRRAVPFFIVLSIFKHFWEFLKILDIFQKCSKMLKNAQNDEKRHAVQDRKAIALRFCQFSSFFENHQNHEKR